MFTTIIVQPIFNLLVLIYAIIPGHNFGLAIILFTVLIRLLMWPLVKKQLHHAKAMRALQPEIKKIKAASKGDKKKESALTMELYKERQINPFASLGIVLVQFPILIGLYSGLRKIIDDPHQLVTFTYPVIHNLPWMENIAAHPGSFDDSLFGVVNLTKTAVGPLYIPALIIVIASATVQFFQSRQLMPMDKDSRSLRQILGDAGKGKNADQQEVNMAVGRTTQFFIPVFVFLIGLRLASALPLYWLASSAVAFIQQSSVLKDDSKELAAVADEPEPKALKAKPKTKTKKAPANRKKKATSPAQRKRKKR